ncbi:MAG: M23 family metallopeptidase [bacterium]|nr:M23 family metallopeptidase [bacterium]
MKRQEKNKNYSIIVVGGPTSTNKEFVISSKLIKNSIAAFVVLLLVFGFIIFDYLTISFDKEKMRRLERDNTNKEETIATLSEDINEIISKLRKMSVFKERISVAMGLTSPDALKEVGRGGGPTSGTIDNLSGNIEVPGIQLKEPANTNDTILEKAKKFRNEAQRIEGTLKFVEDVMEKQKVRLASTPAIWPTKGYLTDPLGVRTHPLTGKRSLHSGQDIATQYGNKVIAPANGVVLVSENRTYYGNLIIIDHGFGYTTRYGHLASFKVKEGDRVKRGQVIGFVGNSGRSSAAHLHYEVRYFGKPQNPMNFIID